MFAETAAHEVKSVLCRGLIFLKDRLRGFSTQGEAEPGAVVPHKNGSFPDIEEKISEKMQKSAVMGLR